MTLEKSTRIALIICATVIVLAVIAAAVISGTAIDPGQLLSGIAGVLGGLLAGLGVAGGPSPAPREQVIAYRLSDPDATPRATPLPRPTKGSSAGPLACIVLALAASQSLGCGAACLGERVAVDALSAGLEAAGAAIPANAADAQEALGYAEGAAELGAVAVDGCDLVRDGAGWQAWVGLALEAARALAAHFGGAAESLPAEEPPSLSLAIELLEAEVEQ